MVKQRVQDIRFLKRSEYDVRYVGPRELNCRAIACEVDALIKKIASVMPIGESPKMYVTAKNKANSYSFEACFRTGDTVPRGVDEIEEEQYDKYLEDIEPYLEKWHGLAAEIASKVALTHKETEVWVTPGDPEIFMNMEIFINME